MNYIPIHTSVYPNYNYLSAENAFLKQTLEYKDAVIIDQQTTIGKLNEDIQQLSSANAGLRMERDKAENELQRWKVMKKIIKSQGSDQQLYEVIKTIDRDIELRKSK